MSQEQRDPSLPSPDGESLGGSEPMLPGKPTIRCTFSRDARGSLRMATEPQDSVLERFITDDIGGAPGVLRHYLGLLDLVQSSGNMVDYGSNVHSTLILPDRVEIEFDYG